VTQPEPREALKKILNLEFQRRYDDGAVIGGMDAYLAQVSASLPRTLAPALERVRRAPGGYRGWDATERATWVASMLALLSPSQPVPPKPAPAQPGAPEPDRPPPESQPITVLTRVSIKTAALFAHLGVRTLKDLLYLLPRRYLDYRQTRPIAALQPYVEQTIVGRVLKASWTYPGGRRSTEALVGDATGTIKVMWFNQPWLARKLPTDTDIVVSGTVSVFGRRLQFISPEWEDIESSGLHTGRLVPVHPLTRGIYAKSMRNWVSEALAKCAPGPAEYLDDDVLRRGRFPVLPEALRQVHFPDTMEHATAARQRLAFDELLSLQLGLLLTRQKWRSSQPGHALKTDPVVIRALVDRLPFSLTEAQVRVLKDILSDLARPVAMSRMLQGDVGSGKTVVALAAMMLAAAHGLQAALMAPTEVLAEQHFRTLQTLLAGKAATPGATAGGDAGASLRANPICTVDGVLDRPLTIALLTGSLTAAHRRRVRAQLASGEVDLVVGTQALVQEGVEFHALGLAVVDEQHRFGVLQRGGLRQKGYNPHVLVMTATPIPRSLALSVYCDLDLSVIDALPPGRQVISTRVYEPADIDLVYLRVRQEVEKGRQAYVICPLINESERLAVRAATEEYEHLGHTVFPDLRLGLLHGAMRPADKDAVMRRFRDGELDVLVSTTVIEVGIDVPNATVMVVLGAERFGLSQLHQLRGRVGRGSEQSYCLLVGDPAIPQAMERLDVLERTHDGFELAKRDMELRGYGDFLGTQQSGLPPLRVATLTDLSTVEKARTEAQRLIRDERLLRDPAYARLRERVADLWSTNVEWS
jgi:ATP-dependent DNA helicase RecG